MRHALLLSLAVMATTPTGADTPAIYQSGRIPTLSATSVEVGGGEVLLEVTVDRMGAVAAVTPLRDTATFTERMVQSVRTWTFRPAEAEIPAARRKEGGPTTETVESRVLVAGVFRRPSVVGITLGEPIKNVATASAAVPSPISVVTPTYPAGTMNPGVVLVEAKVNAKGEVSDASVRISAAGFDSAALSSARQWKFRPAKAGDTAVAAVAYIVFGFPVPKG